MRERAGESIEVRNEILVRGDDQGKKGEKCTNAGDNPARVLDTKRYLRPGRHSYSQNDDQHQSKTKRPQLTGGIGATYRIASTDQIIVVRHSTQHGQSWANRQHCKGSRPEGSTDQC